MEWLNQWRRGRAVRAYKRHFSPRHWRSRERNRRLLFRFNRLLVRLRTRRDAGIESVSVFWGLAKTAVRAAIFSSILLWFIGWLESAVLVDRSNLLQDASKSLGTNSDGYLSVVTTLGGLAGIFLGLYFTALTVVVSSVYSRAPSSIRNLLVAERAGAVYLKLITVLAVSSVICLVATLLGSEPKVLHLLLFLVLGLLSICSFLVLGRRSFDFFDPQRLSHFIVRDLVRYIRYVSSGKPWHSDASIQSHYQRQAQRLIETYSQLLDLVRAHQPQSGRTTAELASNLLGVLPFYARNKLRVPSESHWFRRTLEFPDWFMASDSQINIALATDTISPPKEVADVSWLENDVERIYVEVLSTLVSQHDHANAAFLLNAANQTCGQLVRVFGVDEAFRINDAGVQVVSSRLGELQADLSANNGEPSGDALALIDVYAASSTYLITQVTQALEENPPADLIAAVRARLWPKEASIGGYPIPRDVARQVEFLHERLRFEDDVEGEILSPRWYLRQIVALGFARHIESTVTRLTGLVESSFAKPIGALDDNPAPIIEAHLVLIAMEACTKLAFHGQRLKREFEKLEKYRVVEDIPWPTVDWDEVPRHAGELRESFVARAARVLPSLPTTNYVKERPDYFGQLYRLLCRETFVAFEAGKWALASSAFSAVFLSAFSVMARIMASLGEEKEGVRYAYAKGAIVDVLELSGYGILLAELRGDDIPSVIAKSWDYYLKKHRDPVGFVQALVSMNEPSLFVGITPGDLEHTRWKQAFERKLRSEGLLNRRSFYLDKKEVEHESPLIRAFCRGGYCAHDAGDAFLATYVAARTEADGLEFRWQTQNLIDSIRRESGEPNESE